MATRDWLPGKIASVTYRQPGGFILDEFTVVADFMTIVEMISRVEHEVTNRVWAAGKCRHGVWVATAYTGKTLVGGFAAVVAMDSDANHPGIITVELCGTDSDLSDLRSLLRK
jgi:hypothetical protein